MFHGTLEEKSSRIQCKAFRNSTMVETSFIRFRYLIDCISAGRRESHMEALLGLVPRLRPLMQAR